ncbi:MAG: NfeD family protein [Actinomycetota bacterium]|nr:NfeD family protein [Acidimicrobiia bacterium]MDQ3293312.1 NfeD family protein [Actinomycetota bacterium]
MDDPEIWRWVWIVLAAAFFAGEMTTPGSFFLLPFAIGAAVAGILAFAGVSVAVEAVVFLVVSVLVFAGMRPLARRLDQGGATEGIGSRRLIGQVATVLEPIPAGSHELGLVRVHREEWRAEVIGGVALEVGATVQVVAQQGTRLVVSPNPKEA